MLQLGFFCSPCGFDIANHAIPKYVFITPNLDDDMHDGSVARGDAWLATELPKVMATNAYHNGGVIFLLTPGVGAMLDGRIDPMLNAVSPSRFGEL